MASKKKGAKRKKSFTPASRFLRYQIQNSATPNQETSHYIDLARDLSAINRRLYRQGKVYQVANISITSRNTINGFVSFSTAPDTWVTRASWNRGKKMYDEMNKLVLDMPGSNARKGRYHDYKVYLDNAHRSAAQNRPLDSANNQAGSGEWIASEFHSPDGTTTQDLFTTHLLGAHAVGAGGGDNYESIGLILSYGEARATVNQETPLTDSQGSDDPLLNLFDSGSQVDEIAADLENDANAPPYKLMSGGSEATIGEHYPGSSSNMPRALVNRLVGIGQQGGVSAPTVMVPGFTAICGLIEVEMASAVENDVFDITIELAPGAYKGVAAFDI